MMSRIYRPFNNAFMVGMSDFDQTNPRLWAGLVLGLSVTLMLAGFYADGIALLMTYIGVGAARRMPRCSCCVQENPTAGKG